MTVDKREQKVATFLILCILILGVPGIACADDAAVLPKGVWMISADDNHYLPIDKRFNHDGNTENVATDFNATLNSTVFPQLSQIETGFGLRPGSANLGNTVVSFKYNFDILETVVGYGVTDRLSLGVKVPYRWSQNEVQAALNTANATVGKNLGFGLDTTPLPLRNLPLIPKGTPGYAPLTTEDLQNILGNGLVINGKLAVPGYGFKRFQTWTDSSFGDIEASGKYQYYKTDNWRLAFTGGVRLPTGKLDDPDNLTDYANGGGCWAFLLRSHNDYTGIKNLVLDLTLRYDDNLARARTVRVTDIHHPLTTDEADVSVGIGDIIELETSASYEFLQGTSLTLLYKYGHEFTAHDTGVSRALTTDETAALETETSYSEEIFVSTLSYTTIPLYAAKKFPFAANAFLSYRDRFAGTNNVFKSQYISLGVQVFF
jgi:hypothetical protein